MRSQGIRHLSFFSLACLAILGCSDSSGGRAQPHKTSADRVDHARPKSRKSGLDQQGSPLAVPYVGVGRMERRSGSGSCVQLSLIVKNESSSKFLSGDLSVVNRCDSNMAVLVDPVQVYYRKGDVDFFVHENLIEPVYVVLYIFRSDLGIGQKAFLGDGGLEVHGWPDYATIPSRGSVKIPLTDKQGILAKLAPGEYGAVLSTWVAPTASIPRRSSIDLGMNVDRFNQEHRLGRVDIRPDADRLTSTISTFHVSKFES